MRNTPLQSLQFPVLTSLISKSTVKDEGTDAPLHICGGENKILVESKVKNKNGGLVVTGGLD